MKKILISAGEESADFFAAGLAREIFKQQKGIKILGFGGEKMRQAGVDVRINLVKHALIGFVEVLFNIGGILKAYFNGLKIIREEKIDALIVLDYPGFHLKLIKSAKKTGVKKVIYYITPQVWAWNYKRVNELKKYIDLAIVILPFEKAILEKEGIKAMYFGHPSAANIVNTRSGALKKPKGKTIGIFPGSRTREIRSLLPIMCEACRKIKSIFKDVKFIIFKAGNIKPELINSIIEKSGCRDVEIVDGGNMQMRKYIVAAIAKSGTVTLELALLGIPELLIYKTNIISYFIGSFLAKVRFIGLANIILEKETIKEFIQRDANPNNICREAVRLLHEKKYVLEMKKNFAVLKKLVYKKDTMKNTAKAILQEIK